MPRMNTLHFVGSDFFVSRDEITPELYKALCDCGAPGPTDEAVAYAIKQFNLTGDEAFCRDALRGYGAWEEDELQDHDTNLSRVVWLVGCEMRESETEAYVCSY